MKRYTTIEVLYNLGYEKTGTVFDTAKYLAYKKKKIEGIGSLFEKASGTVWFKRLNMHEVYKKDNHRVVVDENGYCYESMRQWETKIKEKVEA